MDNRAVKRALLELATDFDVSARTVMRHENLYKHVLEVQWILQHIARHNGGICDLGGGVGINLLLLRRLGVDRELVLVDRLDEQDGEYRMGSWRPIVTLLERNGVQVVRQDFWAEPQLPLESGRFAVRYPYSGMSAWVTEPYYEHFREYVRREYEELLRRAGDLSTAEALVPGLRHTVYAWGCA